MSSPSKKQKFAHHNEQTPNQMSIAGPSSEQQQNFHQDVSPPKLFELIGHCFENLLDYLSLRDLHSLGQTCKIMQQLTGAFFKQNYLNANILCCFGKSDSVCAYRDDYNYAHQQYENDIHCIPLFGFIQMITSIGIENSRFSSDLKAFEYIESRANDLKSLKQLSIQDAHLKRQAPICIRKILPQLEILRLFECEITNDFYNSLLCYCENLRKLDVSLCNVRYQDEYKWLRQKYPKLEHFEFELRNECSSKIDELLTFFEYNPNVRSFSTSSNILWANRDALLQSKIQLDVLILKCGNCYNRRVVNLNEICNLLKVLHERQFYKRLHVYAGSHSVGVYSNENANFDVSIEKLSVPHYWYTNNFEAILSNLYELSVLTMSNAGNDYFENLAKNIINVERLCMYNASIDGILPFFQQSKKLRKIKFVSSLERERVTTVKQQMLFKQPPLILKLETLNAERTKLIDARKITIYVPDTIFLATKWATKNGTTNFDMVQMKRIDSYQ